MIDFEKEFVKGSSSYEGLLAEWWIKKSADPYHRRAYKRIAEFICRVLSEVSPEPPRVIVDYACGNGAILKNLVELFPSSQIIALDGSSKLLRHAQLSLEASRIHAKLDVSGSELKLQAPVTLARTSLPDFSLPREIADVAIFLFPNLSISSQEREHLMRRFENQKWTVKTARLLAKLQEESTKISADELVETYLDARTITLNLHRILKKGGFWFQVDYANAPRRQWDKIDQWVSLFEESAWDLRIDHHKIKRHFMLAGSWYFRSSVVLDVYEQSQDPGDRVGGYVISLFRAL